MGPGTSSRDIVPALREMGDLTAGAAEKVEQRSLKRGRGMTIQRSMILAPENMLYYHFLTYD